jgi:primary-amine oxidase
MNTRQVVNLVDTGPVPLAPPGQELDQKSLGRPREGLKPLRITQPHGPSYEVRGHEVRWQHWRFRFAVHPREGPVLYTVSYEDSGRIRPVLYRASLSEMVVPYGDIDPVWAWRAAFDVGEYGVGELASPLERGTDVPEHAECLDATFADAFGNPLRLERAVSLYERDGGLLWRHDDVYSTPRWSASRRARQLVLCFIATIGNYDYAMHWIFHQDGTLELDAGLSGIMLPKGVAAAANDQADAHERPFGHLVSPWVVAPHHQHFFNFRLDLDVDGVNNSVLEMNTRALPAGPENSVGIGMTMEETVFEREQDAQRNLNMASARKWRVINPSVKNGLGHNTGYILVPGENTVPYALLESSVRKRAGFINHHLWVTRYRATELNAGGPYPNQSRGGEGLPQWVADNEPIENEDVVIWYTMGVTHIPRPEEWPVMPATHIGFKLVPAGFFARNPALDVPQ